MAASPVRRTDGKVNNDFYDLLGERWYTAQDDPVALLRAESRARNPWIVREIRRAFSKNPARVLDVGCGAGFLSNELARHGFEVTGLDASLQSLAVARSHDGTLGVKYEVGDASLLPYPDRSFEVVCAMDFLEHVENPERIVSEAARVLLPGGLFFFHTFNRNLISWLVVIKGVEWFVANTPPEMHQLRCFIKPSELCEICGRSGLAVSVLYGISPVLGHAFWRMLLTGRVGDDFRFEFRRRPLTGYAGLAIKQR